MIHKTIIAYSKKELNELIDALEVTDQSYTITRCLVIKETGKSKTTLAETAWKVDIGAQDETGEFDEAVGRIGFTVEDEEIDEE